MFDFTRPAPAQHELLTVLDVLAHEHRGLFSVVHSDFPQLYRNRHVLAKDLAAGRVDADDIVQLKSAEFDRSRAMREPMFGGY